MNFQKYTSIMMMLAITFIWTSAFSQSRPQKPVLIRDTDKAEGKEEAEPSKEKEYSPILAEQSVKVADYYLKQKNFDAAIERYIEALQYQPGRIDAYEGLGKTYEKMGEKLKAQEVYQDFIKKNPDSPKLAEFRAKLAKLEKK